MPALNPKITRFKHSRRTVSGVLASALLFVGALPTVARGPEPPLRLALEPLGFQPPPAGLLVSGSSLIAVHFVDNRHLLLTFSVRRLMKRLAECPPEDSDRVIQALLLDLPGGKILARTEWRVHDQGRYLWSIGEGRFLLRNRDHLSLFTPLSGSSGDPFREYPFLNLDQRQVDVIRVSPENDLLMVESSQHESQAASSSQAVAQPFRAGPPTGPGFERDQPPEQIQFFRIPGPGQLQPALSSVAAAKNPVDIPATGTGIIRITPESRNRWLFDYVSYSGKALELAPFDSSCRPHPVFVSNSEFIAIGCRGTSDSYNIGGFNSLGEQMWQQNFFEPFVNPTVASAPVAGRFALSRALVSSGASAQAAPLMTEQVTGQEIRVYQTESGEVILRVQLSPAELAGENFDLSPDGLSLAVVRNGAVEIYALPVLTAKEQQAVQRASASAPARSQGAAHIPQAPPAETAAPAVPSNPQPLDPSAAGSAPAHQTDPEQGRPVAQRDPALRVSPDGDVDGNGPRKPPTLYGPDEQAPAR